MRPLRPLKPPQPQPEPAYVVAFLDHRGQPERLTHASLLDEEQAAWEARQWAGRRVAVCTVTPLRRGKEASHVA